MQPDLFGETLEKKILRMEKWMVRLHKEILWLKEVHHLAVRSGRIDAEKTKYAQIDMFGT